MPGSARKAKFLNELVPLHLYAEYYDADMSWKLAVWCRTHGADEWTIAAIAVKGGDNSSFQRFDEATTAYRLPTAKRRQMTAHHRRGETWDFVRQTELWRLNSASLSALREALPDGLFTYNNSKESRKQSRIEDPIFYRKGELMLGIVSHEREGVLRVTEQERQLLEAAGLPVRPYGTYVGWSKG